MSAYTKVILLTLIFAILHLSCGQNKCMQCLSDSEAFCVDQTSYHLCVNGKPNKSNLHKCPEGQICTNSESICEQETETTQSVCGSSCNKCPAETSGSNKFYTCVSSTQYGRCYEGVVTIVESCGSGLMCSNEIMLETGKMCVPRCVMEFFDLDSTCSNDVPFTTTIAPPATPNVDDLKAKCKADVQSENIYYVTNDQECKTYIYCEKMGDDVAAVLMKCSHGFYDVNANKCVDGQPEECGAGNSLSPTEQNI